MFDHLPKFVVVVLIVAVRGHAAQADDVAPGNVRVALAEFRGKAAGGFVRVLGQASSLSGLAVRKSAPPQGRLEAHPTLSGRMPELLSRRRLFRNSG